MKKTIILLALMVCTAMVQGQKTTYSDNNLEAQLVSLKGDSVNGTLHPILRIKTKGETEIHLTRPQAWDKYGDVFDNNLWDADVEKEYRPYWTVNADEDVWVTTQFDEYFRIEGWNRRGTYHDTVSVLRIEIRKYVSTSFYEHFYQSGAITFYDIPVEWGAPTELPVNISQTYGLTPLSKEIGVYHGYKHWKTTFDGSLRLEAVAGDINTGQLFFAMQVKADKPAELRANAVTLLYRGEVVTFRGKADVRYSVLPNQWSEFVFAGGVDGPVFVHPSTKKLDYIELSIGSKQEYGEYVARNVPIQWIDLSAKNSASSAKGGATQGSSLVLTSHGVGPLQLGKKFPLPTPKGTFYTSAKKLTADKYSGINYGLYNGSKLVGDVMADFTTQAINSITIMTSAVKMENGIAVGTKVKDALSKGGVKAEIEYDYESSSWSITFRYGNIVLVCNDTDSGLTPDANKRIKNGFYSGNLIFDLPSNFFKDSATISQIIIVNQ